jgi:hypothetical protein
LHDDVGVAEAKTVRLATGLRLHGLPGPRSETWGTRVSPDAADEMWGTRLNSCWVRMRRQACGRLIIFAIFGQRWLALNCLQATKRI